MKTFILNYINTALFIHLACSLALIFLLRLIINSCVKLKSNSIDFTDDEYFVLNNAYEPKKIFYFITYKLYHNGILDLKINQGKFYYVQKDSYSLTKIEKEVSRLYINGLSPKEFSIDMINQNIFKEYFNSVYEKLILNKFIKSKKKILSDRILFILGLLIILVPGIIFIIYLNGLFLSKVFVNLFLALFMYIFILKDPILTNLTSKGLRANENFKKSNPYYSHKLRNNNCLNDMDKFLLQNIYMYYFDSDIDDSDDDDDSIGFDDFDE